jgi:hypothetical protein
MTRTGLFIAVIWSTVMVPFSLQLALWGSPTARTLWRWWGVL